MCSYIDIGHYESVGEQNEQSQSTSTKKRSQPDLE